VRFVSHHYNSPEDLNPFIIPVVVGVASALSAMAMIATMAMTGHRTILQAGKGGMSKYTLSMPHSA